MGWNHGFGNSGLKLALKFVFSGTAFVAASLFESAKAVWDLSGFLHFFQNFSVFRAKMPKRMRGREEMLLNFPR
jgi:hypothetical protein